MLSIIFYILSAFGISLTITAHIGVSSFNSLNLSLASLSGLKIGTMTIIVNSCFLLTYMFLTQFKKVPLYLLQGSGVYLFGFVINFFTYQLLNELVLTTYFSKVLVFIAGTLISGFSTGIVLSLKILAFPLESLCQELAQRSRLSFANYRYGVDLISVLISLSLSLLLNRPLLVREGTLLSLVLLAWAINQSKNFIEQKINPQALVKS